MISTRLLGSMPNPSGLMRLSQAIALLDAILAPEWDYRYYSYNGNWNRGETMASMRNGSGDYYFVLFCEPGVIIKGYVDDCGMADTVHQLGEPWPGVVDGVPEVFTGFIDEPAFSIKETTFCTWCMRDSGLWERGKIQFPLGDDPDGSEELLAIFDGNPVTYKTWADQYYDKNIDLASIADIYAHKRVTSQLVQKLNPGLTQELLRDDILEIGYE